jgi:16S rRNA (cytidine1402-2'-O)-methyltransferase
VACEDTRVTGRLLSLFGIKAKLIAYHDHNGPRVRPKLVEAMESGAVVALVSDAGTPLVSDPGYRLVCDAQESGIAVHAVPGASSILAALAGAGLPSDRFLFAGFLPQKKGARRAALADVVGVPASLIFFESGPRLAASLSDMAAVLGERPAVVARELTKKFEETRRGTLDDLAAHYVTEGGPKGEIVVVVGPPEEGSGPEIDLDGLLRAALVDAPLKSAVDRVTAETALPRRQVYQRALALKDEAP